MRTRNRKNARKDRLKQYLKAKYGMKYDKGGKTGKGNPPEADFLLKRDPLAYYDRETVGVGRGAEDLDTGGFTTASDNARAQMDFLIPPEGMGETRDEQPPEDGGSPPDRMSPMSRRGISPLSRDMKREIKGGPRVVKKERNDDFTGFITAPYLRTGQVPTNIKVRNPKTRQFEDRQMEPEEIADYIFKNQVRRSPSQMMSRDQAYERALKVMRGRS